MRILVTGGAGFIGSHLCERLVQNGDTVIVVDSLFSGSEDNIRHLYGKPNFTFIHHDIVEPFFWEEKIDQVYNLACPASPVKYQENSVRTIKTNTIGMINMLGLALKHDAVFLQTSTSEVYGDPEEHPQKESYRGNVNCFGPRACYDEGKRCAEALCYDYYRMHKQAVKIVRIFNTYGPRMAFDDGRVVSNFIAQALNGNDITVYGEGAQTRSFCYVDDLVEGLIRMMATPREFQGPVNLGNPEEYTVSELANMVVEMTGSKSAIVSHPLPPDDPKKRCPDITRAKEKLDWQPKTLLREGLEKTIADFRKRMIV